MRSAGVDIGNQQLSGIDHSHTLTAAMPESLAFAASVLS
jgi:hypothetical protein